MRRPKKGSEKIFENQHPALQQMVIAQTAMGRLADPHDIGGLGALLRSDNARWLTGQRLEATGGYNI